MLTRSIFLRRSILTRIWNYLYTIRCKCFLKVQHAAWHMISASYQIYPLITFFHSELGNIHSFKDNGAVAKYAGLVWRESQSGNFKAEDTAMSKAGNTYLRYYLLEATNSVIRHEPSFKKYHDRKFEEVKIHKHQRALALTARKFVRLIYGLLAKGQLY